MTAARRLLGYHALCVTGADPARFLTELAQRGVLFFGAEPPEDYTLRVCVPAGSMARARAAAAASGCEIAGATVRGLPRAGARLRRRWPFAALFLVALAALVVAQGRIWYIGVEGNETVPDGVILQAAEECGVYIGARWLDLSQDAVRTSVLLRVPELRWMTVTMQGCRARVIVREKYTHEPLMDERTPSRIVAAKAGLITRVEALHGTAVTEPGRACLPGETLIDGVMTGRSGALGETWAWGRVTARTWYELTAEAPASVTEKTYTGGRTVRYALVFGKNRINFYKDSSICPPECDKIIETAEARRDGAFMLPLALEKTTYVRYETCEVPAAELREELEETLMRALTNAIGVDGTVDGAVFTASEKGGVLRVTLRAECTEQIGRREAVTERITEDTNE